MLNLCVRTLWINVISNIMQLLNIQLLKHASKLCLDEIRHQNNSFTILSVYVVTNDVSNIWAGMCSSTCNS